LNAYETFRLMKIMLCFATSSWM